MAEQHSLTADYETPYKFNEGKALRNSSLGCFSESTENRRKPVLAESYERIHRSNLVGMGVLPLQYKPGENAESLGLTGEEQFSISGIANDIRLLKEVDVIAVKPDGGTISFQAIARLDSKIEIEYYRNGGILQYVLSQFLQKA